MRWFLALPLWALQSLLCHSRPSLPRDSDSAVALEVTHSGPSALMRRGGFLQGRCDNQDRPADILFSAGNSEPHDYYMFDVETNGAWQISEFKLYTRDGLIPGQLVSAQLVDTNENNTICGCMTDCSQNASSAFDGLLQTDVCATNGSIKLNISFQEPKAVTMYTVVSSGRSGSADPAAWSFFGFKNGQRELLGRQEGIKFASASWMCTPPFFATTTTSTMPSSQMNTLDEPHLSGAPHMLPPAPIRHSPMNTLGGQPAPGAPDAPLVAQPPKTRGSGARNWGVPRMPPPMRQSPMNTLGGPPAPGAPDAPQSRKSMRKLGRDVGNWARRMRERRRRKQKMERKSAPDASHPPGQPDMAVGVASLKAGDSD